MSQRFRVSDAAPNGLTLRSRARVKPDTRIALLPMGHAVEKLGESGTAGWWKVSTTLGGAALTGFVSSDYLTPDASFAAPAAENTLRPVHLKTDRPVVRAVQSRMASPLNEPGQPGRDRAAAAPAKAAALTGIVEWLDVEHSARYSPNTQHTYCNIYAYDFCWLADVYLPRVWWLSSAITRLQNGQAVAPVYGETIGELNANSLFNWFREYGATFGWSRTFDLTALQNAANEGQVAIICGQNKIPNRSGHIVAVVPETGPHTAGRTGGKVSKPLQSQAGRNNRKYSTQAWWTDASFRDFGFWINPS